MESYTPIDNKALAPSTRKMVFVLGLFGLAYGFYALKWMWIVSGVLLALVALFRKETQVSGDGILITYHIAFYTHTSSWPMAEIEYLHSERDKVPGQVMLHFTRGAMSRRLLFSESDSQRVVAMARRANPAIFVEEANKRTG